MPAVVASNRGKDSRSSRGFFGRRLTLSRLPLSLGLALLGALVISACAWGTPGKIEYRPWSGGETLRVAADGAGTYEISSGPMAGRRPVRLDESARNQLFENLTDDALDALARTGKMNMERRASVLVVDDRKVRFYALGGQHPGRLEDELDTVMGRVRIGACEAAQSKDPRICG